MNLSFTFQNQIVNKISYISIETVFDREKSLMVLEQIFKKLYFKARDQFRDPTRVKVIKTYFTFLLPSIGMGVSKKPFYVPQVFSIDFSGLYLLDIGRR